MVIQVLSIRVIILYSKNKMYTFMYVMYKIELIISTRNKFKQGKHVTTNLLEKSSFANIVYCFDNIRI